MALGVLHSYFVKEHLDANVNYTKSYTIHMNASLIDNILLSLVDF